MYITAFAHREELFAITERWLCGRLEPDDGLRITEILICDGFVVRETVETTAKVLVEMVHDQPFRLEPIRRKGELRDALCRNPLCRTPRVEELVRFYRSNPDYFYREAPINGVMCLGGTDELLGLFRIKRPKRIAEKANRYIANWIFGMVQEQARIMAEERAREMNIALEDLLTPAEEMTREFAVAERRIASKFHDSSIRLDRRNLTINDVGGIKLVAEPVRLAWLEEALTGHSAIRIVDKETHQGNYSGTNLILAVPFDREHICRCYHDSRAWEKYPNRGITEERLRGLMERLLKDVTPSLNLEVILSTFPDLVESELGSSIHEEMILAQRGTARYRGYLPTNVEFLVEYLFAVGFSPKTRIEQLPIKLWGRYLPDTVISDIRQLFDLPENELFY